MMKYQWGWVVRSFKKAMKSVVITYAINNEENMIKQRDFGILGWDIEQGKLN